MKPTLQEAIEELRVELKIAFNPLIIRIESLLNWLSKKLENTGGK